MTTHEDALIAHLRWRAEVAARLEEAAHHHVGLLKDQLRRHGFIPVELPEGDE